jgi:hypothetical protein
MQDQDALLQVDGQGVHDVVMDIREIQQAVVSEQAALPVNPFRHDSPPSRTPTLSRRGRLKEL